MVLIGGLYWLVIGVVVVAALAALLIPLALLDVTGDDPSDAALGMAFLWILIGWQVMATLIGQVLGLLSSQALAQAVSEHEGGGRVSAGRVVSRAIGVFWQQLPTALLYSLGVLAGSFLCVIPGVYLQIRWAFALPMGAREGVRGSGALGASWRLTDGRAGVTFLVTLIGGLAMTGLLIAGLVGAFLTQAVFGSPVIGLAVLALLTAFAATCVAVLVGSLLNQFVAADSVGTDPVRVS